MTKRLLIFISLYIALCQSSIISVQIQQGHHRYVKFQHHQTMKKATLFPPEEIQNIPFLTNTPYLLSTGWEQDLFIHPGSTPGTNNYSFLQTRKTNDFDRFWIIEKYKRGSFGMCYFLKPFMRQHLALYANTTKVYVSQYQGKESKFLWRFSQTSSIIPFNVQVSKIIRCQNQNERISFNGGTQSPIILQTSTSASNNAYWFFSSESLDINMKSFISNFHYDDNVEAILQNHHNPTFISSHNATIDEHTLGSSISQEFRKTVTNSFTWGMTQSFGFGVAVQIKAGIPLIGGVTTTVTATFDMSFDQSWSKSEGYQVVTIFNMVMNTPGTYKVSGWVDMIQDLTLPYTAQIKMTGMAVKEVNNQVILRIPIQRQMIRYILRRFYNTRKEINSTAESVTLQTKGSMTGAYGMTGFSTYSKIG